MHQPIIIGAGLTSLTAAYCLQQKGISCTILEARPQAGGRIRTSRRDGGTPVEMGATWLGAKHTELVSLLKELELSVFPQITGGRAIYEAISTSPPQVVDLPHNDQPSYRIAGGSDTLIQKLAAALPAETIHFDTVVKSVTFSGDTVSVNTNNGEWTTNQLVSTLPPNLLASTINFSPELPEKLVKIARQTQTWMGESIKVGLRYATPFWREAGKSGGTIFSNVGPITEMYDHTNVEDTQFALKGFMNGTYHALTTAERKAMVLNQLRKYYGAAVDDHLAYEEGVWRQEPYTFVVNEGQVMPHQHNGHPIFRETYFGGRLIIAGSETAERFPGYMDGAVLSGRRIAGLLG